MRHLRSDKLCNIFEQNILSVAKYGIELYGITNLEKCNKLINKIIFIMVEDQN
jgi:hypothetical protein